MLRPSIRIFERHLVPRWVASVYYLLRDGGFLSPLARVQCSSRISFGRGSVVKPYAVIQTHTGRVAFGRKCSVSSFDHISTGDADVVIGDMVLIGPNVTILGGTREVRDRSTAILNQDVANPQGVTIGSDVLVGAGVVILPGVRIEDGAVIGAGSVVTSDIPAFAIVAGSPARVIGERS